MITELIIGRKEINLMRSNRGSNIFSAKNADQRLFSDYFRLLEVGSDGENCQRAVRFAVEERHEMYGNENLACRLLSKAISQGIGFNEALELLLRLEDRADQDRAFSAPSGDACYDCYDDPELLENIDLLKRALLENIPPSTFPRP